MMMNQQIIKALKLSFASLGGWITFFFGGCDAFLYTLFAFIIFDYIFGIVSAIITKTISSKTGFKGILKKALIIMMVSAVSILDFNCLHLNGTLRSFIITFYIANEGISILENLSKCGVPFPQKIKCVLNQLKEDKEDDGNDSRNTKT